jgi:CBS domain-containing protein
LVQPVPEGPPVTDTVAAFAGAAITLPHDVTGDQVREVFRDHQDETVVVLVDQTGNPVGSLDRNRFMLAMSGQFGHALHASRPALRVADQPRTLPSDASAGSALQLLSHGEPSRRNDDIVVTDAQGRCVGVAHVTDLLRGAAEVAHERALVLDPATRLGGLAVLRPALVRRIALGCGFVAGWLVPELGPMLEDGGFVAAETALRQLTTATQTALRTDPGADLGHILGGLVVLTTAEAAAQADQTLRRLLAEEHGPTLYSAWLRCEPGTTPAAGRVDATLATVLTRAKAQGAGTTLTEVLH